MSFWSIIWLVLILFTFVSFIYMSAKVLFFGIFELKYMFKTLEDEQIKNNKSDNNAG